MTISPFNGPFTFRQRKYDYIIQHIWDKFRKFSNDITKS